MTEQTAHDLFSGPGGTGSDSGRFLRELLRQQDLNLRDLAHEARLDERTVNAAVNGKRTPKPGTARAIAHVLNVAVEDLWPQPGIRPGPDAPTINVRVFPSRAHIPPVFWSQVFEDARARIDICVYGGTFLFDAVPGFTRILTRASQRGVAIRFVAGDPDSAAVYQRGREEPIGPSSLANRCRMTLAHMAPVSHLPGVEIRQQATPLYASLFFIDETVYANTHFFGSPAGDNPVIELTKDADPDRFELIEESFTRTWDAARPATFTQPHQH